MNLSIQWIFPRISHDELFPISKLVYLFENVLFPEQFLPFSVGFGILDVERVRRGIIDDTHEPDKVSQQLIHESGTNRNSKLIYPIWRGISPIAVAKLVFSVL